MGEPVTLTAEEMERGLALMEAARPTATTVWTEIKDNIRRLDISQWTTDDLNLLEKFTRARWASLHVLEIDLHNGADHERLAELLQKHPQVWQDGLSWQVEGFRWGEVFGLPEELQPVEAHSTDLGNAQRLVARHGTDLCYCHPWRRWLVWDGRRWRVDDTAEVIRRAKDTVRSIYTEAAEADDTSKRKGLARWAMQSEAETRIKAMIKLAESEPGIPVLPDELDADPWLLNVNNGTLDLRTGELRPHNRAGLITKLAPVDYNPKATCPLWRKFLDEIMGGDENMIAFLQRATGYSLTGDTSERSLFIPCGHGANGKTTFLEVERAMLGDYALRTPTETLMLKRAGMIPNDVARLRGARFVSASESEEGRRLAEALVKDLTGGDTISARFMRAEWFDFRPECKVWLATNHKPEVRGTDKAIWDRIKLIPFEVTIAEDKQDKHLADKLKAELPGILAWAVEGCLDWQREGLGVTEKVKAATTAYRNEMDVIGGFVADCCVEGRDKTALAGDLFDAYKKWGGDLSQTRFGRALRERGFERDREPTTGRIEWHGLGLLSEQSEQSEPENTITESVENSIRNNREKGSDYSTVQDAPLVKVAVDRGAEVAGIEYEGETIPW